MSGRPAGPGSPAAGTVEAAVVVGVGASKGAAVEEVLGLVEEALREAGLSVASVAELATVEAKAGEPGVVGAARRLGVPLVTYRAEELAGVGVPHPSDGSRAAVGTPSVAEASALLRGGELLVPKRKSARATCAVAVLDGGDGRRYTTASSPVDAVDRDHDGHHPQGHGYSHAH